MKTSEQIISSIQPETLMLILKAYVGSIPCPIILKSGDAVYLNYEADKFVHNIKMLPINHPDWFIDHGL